MEGRGNGRGYTSACEPGQGAGTWFFLACMAVTYDWKLQEVDSSDGPPNEPTRSPLIPRDHGPDAEVPLNTHHEREPMLIQHHRGCKKNSEPVSRIDAPVFEQQRRCPESGHSPCWSVIRLNVVGLACQNPDGYSRQDSRQATPASRGTGQWLDPVQRTQWSTSQRLLQQSRPDLQLPPTARQQCAPTHTEPVPQQSRSSRHSPAGLEQQRPPSQPPPAQQVDAVEHAPPTVTQVHWPRKQELLQQSAFVRHEPESPAQQRPAAHKRLPQQSLLTPHRPPPRLQQVYEAPGPGLLQPSPAQHSASLEQTPSYRCLQQMPS